MIKSKLTQHNEEDTTVKKLDMVYEGKAKKVFKTDDENVFIVDYKDDALSLIHI